jgi:membrane fusion protein (multidrug efflux system)
MTTTYDAAIPVTGRAPGKLDRLRALPRRALIVAGSAAAAIILGGAWIAMPASSVSTDDAYVKADNTIIAPKISGLVSAVLVRENAHVVAGQELIRIDDEDYAQAVASAEADVASAEALLAQQSAQESLAAANVTASETAIRAADAERVRADADRRRYDALVKSANISRRDAERVRATAVAAEADADKVRAAYAASREQQSVVAHSRAQLQAALAKARASLSMAKLNLAHSVIRAPVAGIVGDRQVQIGEYVQPGSQLMTIVPADTIYVAANFKETQTARMLAGQKVHVKIDALPGHGFDGVVESFAPASGSEFALLPFEPATGNFTRIVQRLPVRIHIDPGQEGAERLRPGLSAKVTVDLTEN